MSAERTLSDATSRMRPVSLEEVLAIAELQTRFDRKYVVPLDTFATVLDEMGDQLSVLQIGDLRLFRYESVYFDTPELTAYRQHAHGRRRRVKIRTRAYLDSGECVLEFKRVGGTRRDGQGAVPLPHGLALRPRRRGPRARFGTAWERHQHTRPCGRY